MQHEVKRKVAKAEQEASDELYERLDTKEGGKHQCDLGRKRNQDGRMCNRFS